VRFAVTRHDPPDRPDRPDIPLDEPAWTSPRDEEEAEPDWAAKIRSGRRDRGARLREVYARFPGETTPLDDPEDPVAPEDPAPSDDAGAPPHVAGTPPGGGDAS
jgi:hypothetical protein